MRMALTVFMPGLCFSGLCRGCCILSGVDGGVSALEQQPFKIKANIQVDKK
jgi:hypothetical protein